MLWSSDKIPQINGELMSNLQDGQSCRRKTNRGPSKAEIAAAFIEELQKGANKTRKHTLNDLIVQKRQTTSTGDMKK